MNGFTKSLLVLIGFLLLGATKAGTVSDRQGPPERPRYFYMTQSLHNGAQALSACAAGYHMASMWEIYDPSNLRYETRLGRTQDDSGFGPPTTVVEGWIRTGYVAKADANIPGRVNCNAWTSSNFEDSGTLVHFSQSWDAGGPGVVSWVPVSLTCSVGRPVWCVQD